MGGASTLMQSPQGGSLANNNIKNMIQGVASIKKKTLAAYSNPRARNNNRNNLIYTQK